MPHVSVIIPAYNCDRYLSQAIDSVLQQSYRDYEVIVIDDGSTDGTQALLQTYGTKIRSVYQNNQGVALARNHGVAIAQGELIAFLDADDFFLPDKLAAQVEIFAQGLPQQPDLGIVHSGWYRVDAAGQRLITVEPWQKIPSLNLETWLRWKPVLPSAMMFRRQWLEQVGGFDPRFPPAEDTELVLRLALQGCQSAWLPQVTVGYRQHQASAMHKGLPQARSLAAVMDHFFSQPDIPQRIRWLESQVRYNTLVWIAWYLYYTDHPAEMVEYLKGSLQYSPYSVLASIVHWADSFTAYSQSWGCQFDAFALVQRSEWRDLMDWLKTDLFE